ncbi:MAG: hypothetical protein KDD69_03055 [Bdellovibrionales bacterium]|nr:hypothetical protein [Bdellovibrionales bacterium]
MSQNENRTKTRFSLPRFVTHLFLALFAVVAVGMTSPAQAETCYSCTKTGCVPVSANSPLVTVCAGSTASSTKATTETIDGSDSSDPSDSEDNSKVCTVKKFSASWCGPCKLLAPVFDAAISEVKKTHVVTVHKYDIDTAEGEQEKGQYGVTTVPTVVVEWIDRNNNKSVRKIVGYSSKTRSGTIELNGKTYSYKYPDSLIRDLKNVCPTK